MNMHEWEGERTREPEDVTCAKNGGSLRRSHLSARGYARPPGSGLREVAVARELAGFIWAEMVAGAACCATSEQVAA